MARVHLTQRTDSYHFSQRRSRFPLHCSVLIFSFLCWLIAALLLIGYLGLQQQRHLPSPASQKRILERHAGQPPLRRLPRASTSKPRGTPLPPAPITPFPSTLEEQIAALQAKDRFFYGGSSQLPEIALTFDDGPNPPYTTQVLALLKHYGIPATFFCVGSQVAAYPELVKQEAAAGYTIGNHSWSHPLLTSLSNAEIMTQLTTTSDIIQRTTGVRPTFFRPPYGALNAQVLTQVNRLGLTTFIWSDGSLDWTMIGPDAISNQVLSNVANGAIILMHDGGGNRWRTVAALPSIIESLQARHFRFVTLAQLVADTHVKAVSQSSLLASADPLNPQGYIRRRSRRVGLV